MKAGRLIESWEAPKGYRLVSVVATTYELQADFLEEDLLPVALGLRLLPARGRDFRVELEHALADTEVSIFFHPGRYQPGLRRSPRVDLIPLPEGRYPKLHAKVALLRFATPEASDPENDIVRLVVGSANLTNSGYRSNIEVAACISDTPSATAEAATVVRDAVRWIEKLIGQSTDQVTGQLRDMNAVFVARPQPRRTGRLRFVGLPSMNGSPLLKGLEKGVEELTIASPFWPTGDDHSDIAAALFGPGGGHCTTVRLIGPALLDEQQRAWPKIPKTLLRALLDAGAKVEVSAADPTFGCTTTDDEEDSEFDDVAERRGSKVRYYRSLHAKAILAVGSVTTLLAIGSFNFTRKGLGLIKESNAEAGVLWKLPNTQSSGLKDVVAFSTPWREVTHRPDEFVVEPEAYEDDDDSEGGWPAFILSLRAKRDQLLIKGDASSWPRKVVIRMRDIRSRLWGQEEWFDPWTVHAPKKAVGDFSLSTPLHASWLERSPQREGTQFPLLPDLEAEVSWEGKIATVPVTFEDKHLFPVVELRSPPDEQSLIAWFLGLRPADEMEDGGFGHSIDPLPRTDELPPITGDILSYLVRDFVHALPGIRNRLADAGMTETGLRTALLGNRSPVELVRESLRAYRNPQPDRPHKTALATVFQLREVQRLLQTVPLPALAPGVADALRNEAVSAVSSALDEVLCELAAEDYTEVLLAYLGSHQG